MKRILYIIIAALSIVSCGSKNKDTGKEELTLEQKLYGEWHSTKLAIDADIYISFMENGRFELYQQIGEGAHRVFRGTWNLEEDLLTGKYNDGEDWAAAYYKGGYTDELPEALCHLHGGQDKCVGAGAGVRAE